MHNKMEDLIISIKKKKELASLDDSYIEEHIKKYLRANKKTKSKFESVDFKKFSRSKEFKELNKKIRSDLRNIYGLFIEKDYSKKNGLLQKLKDSKKIEQDVRDIMKLHVSTKERLPYYNIIYKKIFQITGTPNKILDLGCGFNPLSSIIIKKYNSKVSYTATDLSSKDCDFLNDFFSIANIDGTAFQFDLINFKDNPCLKNLKSDICFILKLIDPIESQKRHHSKLIISSIPSKWIIASFSKTTIGGKTSISKDKRAWFENFLKKSAYKYTTFEIPNELFYVIKK